MAFTVMEFPHLVFENIKQYHKYLEMRKRIRTRLFSRSFNKTKVVKVASTIRRSDPTFEYIKSCVIKYLTE